MVFAQSPQGLVALLSLMPQGHFFGQVLNNTSFLLPEQKKRNKENSPSALFVLLRHFSPLNKKNSLTLKQLFVFYAPKSTSASRPKSEAGPFCFYATSLRLLGRDVFFSFARSFLSSRAEQSVVKDLGSIAQPIGISLVGGWCLVSSLLFIFSRT